jgi:cobalt-zinc-cadmium resistance protein CzcA
VRTAHGSACRRSSAQHFSSASCTHPQRGADRRRRVCYKQLNIEAYPDPVPPLVDIVTQNPGQSSEEIERYITSHRGADGGPALCQLVRSISLVGLSDVKVQFTYDISYREASILVTNRLSQLASSAQRRTAHSVADSPIGEIFRYRVVGPPATR